jgi:hypothetical protein
VKAGLNSCFATKVASRSARGRGSNSNARRKREAHRLARDTMGEEESGKYSDLRGNGECDLRRKRVPHSDYLFRTATHWRMRAEAMRMLAEDAEDSKVRAMMLRIAADYERLASNADDRAAQDSIMFRLVSPEDKSSAGAASGHRDGQRAGRRTRRRLDSIGSDDRAPARRSSLGFTPNHRLEGDQ